MPGEGTTIKQRPARRPRDLTQRSYYFHQGLALRKKFLAIFAFVFEYLKMEGNPNVKSSRRSHAKFAENCQFLPDLELLCLESRLQVD